MPVTNSADATRDLPIGDDDVMRLLMGEAQNRKFTFVSLEFDRLRLLGPCDSMEWVRLPDDPFVVMDFVSSSVVLSGFHEWIL
jgi:hypothetical protein